MIGSDQLANGIAMGLILIVLGLVPGLYQALEDGLVRCASLLPIRSPFLARSRTFQQPRWFAAVGVILILLTMLAYVTK